MTPPARMRSACERFKVGTSMRYAFVIERTASNFSAYVPDLPGCVATCATVGEVERSIREAFEFGSTPLKLRVRKRTD